MRRRIAAGSEASPKKTLLNRRLAPQRVHVPSAIGPLGSDSRQWCTQRLTAGPR